MIQSGGQRLQPEVRLRAERALPACFIQENFGMAEGLIMFVRAGDPPDVRRRPAACPSAPTTRFDLVDEDGNVVPYRRARRAVRPRPLHAARLLPLPEHNARAFTPDGFYRSGDLHAAASVRQLHGRGPQVKDLINRGGEKISAEEIENLILTHPAVENVACVPYAGPGARRADVRLPRIARRPDVTIA